MTKRKYLTKPQKRRLLDGYGWKCAGPGCQEEIAENATGRFVDTGNRVVRFDHIHQLAMDGGNEFENFRPLCMDCDAVKTRNDAKARAKVRRIKGVTKKRLKRKIQSKGFDTRLRKKMNGTVIER